MSSSDPTVIHPLLVQRVAGVLLHPTSLPSFGGAFGIGDVGPTARRFVDWAASAGLRRWQMLPIGPVGEGESPYSARSSFAIEPMLTSVADLAEDGYLPTSAVRLKRNETVQDDRGRASWRRVRGWKQPRLEAAFQKFQTRRGRMGLRGMAYADFRTRQAAWLDDWCRYQTSRTSKHRSGNTPECDPMYHAFVQFVLDRQWSRLQQHAHERELRLIGDLPFFCAPDSADVTSRPDLFRLDESGHPTLLTGIPPASDPDDITNSVWGDAAVHQGQLWGHPHYNWAAHQKEHWAWWRDRVCTPLERFDLIRIDHFYGFLKVFEIPRGTTDLRNGSWQSTPGDELLAALKGKLGRLPCFAEDLGERPPQMQQLCDRYGLVGMRMLQTAFFGTAEAESDLPHNHPPLCVVYPGCHDNDTVAGWYRDLDTETRRRFAHYAGPSAASDPAGTMARLAYTSPAHTAIVQMQDFLGLNRRARMNRPGNPTGNWCWRMRRSDTPSSLARRLEMLASATQRLG
ncbi:4-alpha-glucanotransferase [Rubripirellula sp.]|nr:4-alpha-glucanotransferase [Rubripirellula sp.]MDF1844082.1 4-alpha-glucanotransferase [Rubripirellula sp.]